MGDELGIVIDDINDSIDGLINKSKNNNQNIRRADSGHDIQIIQTPSLYDYDIGLNLDYDDMNFDYPDPSLCI